MRSAAPEDSARVEACALLTPHRGRVGVSAHIGPGERYLAVHVRPYPDTCLDLWASTPPGAALNRTAEEAHCHSKRLDEKLAHAVPQMLRAHNLTKVFLMSHPKIRDYVQAVFAQAGIEAGDVHHLLPEHVASQLGGQCNMRLLLMERYIVEQAQAFLGTVRSSISLGVTLSRLANDPKAPSTMMEAR